MKKIYFLLLILLACNLSFGQVVPSGLISYYQFEKSDLNGDSILDKTENRNKAIVVNGAIFTSDREGNPEEAIILGGQDNNDNYVTINSAFDRTSINSIKNFTVSFWYSNEHAEGSDKKPILAIKDNAGVSYLLELDSDKIQWTNNNGSVQAISILSSFALQDNEWYNIAFTIDAVEGNVSLYINGQLEGEGAGIITKPLNPSLTLAANPGVSLSGFPAMFDELYIYDRVLSVEEINMVKSNCTALPQTPVVTDGAICGSGSLTLSSDIELLWYSNKNGGTPFYRGKSYATPALNSTSKYYVSSISAEGCEGIFRVPVIAAVNSIPEPPIAEDVFGCASRPVTLTASGSSDYKWYNSEGLLIGSGSTFTTQNLLTSTDFFVSSISPSGCESPVKVPVKVAVGPVPSPPTAEDVSGCWSEPIILTASGGSYYKWYSSASEVLSIESEGTYITQELRNTTDFFVSSISSNGCESERILVKAIIYPVVDIIPPHEGFNSCGPGSFTFEPSGDFEYLWYSEDGTLLSKGKTFTTPVLTTDTKYIVEVLHNFQCLGTVKGTAEVKVANFPKFEVVGDLDVKENSVHTYITDAPADAITWSVEGGIGSSDSNSIEVTWLEPGPGKVKVTVGGPFGCTQSKELYVNKGVGTAGVKAFDLMLNETKIFPNPSEGKFTIDCPLPVEEITLTNILGQKKSYYSDNVESDFKGLVFVEIKTSKGTIVKKMEIK